jgi:hypothetical protein
MKQDTRGPADLEYQIEYLTNQNDFLKRSNKKLVEKNNNFRLVRNEGKVL